MNLSLHKKRRRTIRGSIVVEAALLTIPLIIMMFGTTEIGRAIYTYNTLDKAARDAARHLSQHGPGESGIADEARCLVAYGSIINCAGPNTLVPGFDKDKMIEICDASTPPPCVDQTVTIPGVGSINLVTVSITEYPYNSFVEWIVKSMKFNDISVTMRGQL